MVSIFHPVMVKGGGTPLTGQRRPAFIGRVKEKSTTMSGQALPTNRLCYTQIKPGGGGADGLVNNLLVL